MKNKIGVWTENEMKYLVDEFPFNYTSLICKKLNRSYRSVCGKAHIMGIKKSGKFREMELKRQADRLKIGSIKTRYQNGHPPANKGKKQTEYMTPAGIQRSEKTRFKKGNIPSNTKFNGHERLTRDGYVMIRIAKGNYVLKSRHIWEKKNGKIPKGFIVVFKDRNPKNIVLKNLELISREENMQRNTINRFKPELKSTIRLVNKLKRTIHAKEQN